MSRFLNTTTGRLVDPELVSDQCRNLASCCVCKTVLVHKSEGYDEYTLAVGTEGSVHYDYANEETKTYWEWYKTYGAERFVNVHEEQYIECKIVQLENTTRERSRPEEIRAIRRALSKKE